MTWLLQLMYFILTSEVEAVAPPLAAAVILNSNTLLTVVIAGILTTGASSSDEVIVIAYPAKFWRSPMDPPETCSIWRLVTPQFELLKVNELKNV